MFLGAGVSFVQCLCNAHSSEILLKCPLFMLLCCNNKINGRKTSVIRSGSHATNTTAFSAKPTAEGIGAATVCAS